MGLAAIIQIALLGCFIWVVGSVIDRVVEDVGLYRGAYKSIIPRFESLSREK